MVDGRAFRNLVKMINNIKILLLGKFNQIYTLFFLVILIMVFEMIGIGLIPVYALLITNPEMILSKIPSNLYFSFLDHPDGKSIIFYGAILLFIAFLIKNLFLGLLIYIEGNLIKGVRINSAKKLYSSYISSNYLFYVNGNPASFTKILKYDLGHAYRYIQSSILLLREVLLVVIILVLLLMVNIKVYLTAFLIFSSFTLIFNYVYKATLVGKGKALQSEHELNFDLVNQTFASIKEIKIYQKESFFSKIFFKNIEKLEELQFFTGLVSKFPRLFLEILSVFMVSSFSLVIYYFKSEDQLIFLIALLSAACIRFIPAFTSITNSLNSIKMFSSSVHTIVQELKSTNLQFSYEAIVNEKKIQHFEFNKNIEFKKLSFGYPGATKKTLQDVDITINKGDFVALIGESGSGKTTLINLILGFLSQDSGSIEVDGININKNIAGWQLRLGYVPQDIYLIDVSIKENIAFGVPYKEIDEDRLNKAVKESRLEEFIESLPNGLDTNTGYIGAKMSGGQRQRIGIARALYTKPEILILDEATNALDIENENKIFDTLLENKIVETLIIISHRQNNLHRFNRVYEVKKSKVNLQLNEKK